MAMGLIHNRLHFLQRKSGVPHRLRVGVEMVAFRGMKFDPISAVVNLLTHRLARSPGRVHCLISVRQVYFGRAEDTVAGSDQSHGSHLQPGPGEKTALNRLLHVHVCITASVAHDIAQCRESCFQIPLRILQCY